MASTLSTQGVSTLGVAHTLLHGETVEGARRSRFSFHLNTRRSRRWLLVQWVSVPVDKSAERAERLAARHDSDLQAPRPTMGKLLDDYSNSRLFNRCA